MVLVEEVVVKDDFESRGRTRGVACFPDLTGIRELDRVVFDLGETEVRRCRPEYAVRRAYQTAAVNARVPTR